MTPLQLRAQAELTKQLTGLAFQHAIRLFQDGIFPTKNEAGKATFFAILGVAASFAKSCGVPEQSIAELFRLAAADTENGTAAKVGAELDAAVRSGPPS